MSNSNLPKRFDGTDNLSAFFQNVIPDRQNHRRTHRRYQIPSKPQTGRINCRHLMLPKLETIIYFNVQFKKFEQTKYYN